MIICASIFNLTAKNVNIPKRVPIKLHFGFSIIVFILFKSYRL